MSEIMWPLGTYDRFLRKIKGQEFSQEKVNYFGVLFCDVRQTNAREYVLNYLDVFNKRSGKYIDFYIPGYIPAEEYYGSRNHNAIYIGKQKYIFDQSQYIEFCDRFEHDFGVGFPFSATLVLLEYNTGHFSKARKIVFELEYSESGIKSAGNLFLNIFNCAETGRIGSSLDTLSACLSVEDKRKLIWATAQCILNLFGVDVEPVLDQYQNIRKYRVK
nr:hypothetical protein [Ruthenibacterium lactatiformans]